MRHIAFSALANSSFVSFFRILGHKRRHLTKSQKRILMKTFQASKYLTRKEKHELAMSMNLKKRSIENWYCRTRRNKAAEGTFSPSELCSIIHYQTTLINTYRNYWLSSHSLYLVTHTDPCKLAHTHTHTDIHTRQHIHRYTHMFWFLLCNCND